MSKAVRLLTSTVPRAAPPPYHRTTTVPPVPPYHQYHRATVPPVPPSHRTTTTTVPLYHHRTTTVSPDVLPLFRSPQLQYLKGYEGTGMKAKVRYHHDDGERVWMIDNALPQDHQLFDFSLTDKTLLKKPSKAVSTYHDKHLNNMLKKVADCESKSTHIHLMRHSHPQSHASSLTIVNAAQVETKKLGTVQSVAESNAVEPTQHTANAAVDQQSTTQPAPQELVALPVLPPQAASAPPSHDGGVAHEPDVGASLAVTPSPATPPVRTVACLAHILWLWCVAGAPAAAVAATAQPVHVPTVSHLSCTQDSWTRPVPKGNKFIGVDGPTDCEVIVGDPWDGTLFIFCDNFQDRNEARGGGSAAVRPYFHKMPRRAVGISTGFSAARGGFKNCVEGSLEKQIIDLALDKVCLVLDEGRAPAAKFPCGDDPCKLDDTIFVVNESVKQYISDGLRCLPDRKPRYTSVDEVIAAEEELAKEIERSEVADASLRPVRAIASDAHGGCDTVRSPVPPHRRKNMKPVCRRLVQRASNESMVSSKQSAAADVPSTAVFDEDAFRITDKARTDCSGEEIERRVSFSKCQLPKLGDADATDGEDALSELAPHDAITEGSGDDDPHPADAEKLRATKLCARFNDLNHQWRQYIVHGVPCSLEQLNAECLHIADELQSRYHKFVPQKFPSHEARLLQAKVTGRF